MTQNQREVTIFLTALEGISVSKRYWERMQILHHKSTNEVKEIKWSAARESNDTLDWIKDKKPVEEIKAGVGMLQHHAWRQRNYSLRDFKV